MCDTWRGHGRLKVFLPQTNRGQIWKSEEVADVCTQTDLTDFFHVLTILGSPVSTWSGIYSNRVHPCRLIFRLQQRLSKYLCSSGPLKAFVKVFTEPTFQLGNYSAVPAPSFFKIRKTTKQRLQSFAVFAVWFLCLCTFLSGSWVTAKLFPPTCPCLQGTCSRRLLLNWRLNNSWRRFN